MLTNHHTANPFEWELVHKTENPWEYIERTHCPDCHQVVERRTYTTNGAPDGPVRQEIDSCGCE